MVREVASPLLNKEFFSVFKLVVDLERTKDSRGGYINLDPLYSKYGGMAGNFFLRELEKTGVIKINWGEASNWVFEWDFNAPAFIHWFNKNYLKNLNEALSSSNSRDSNLELIECVKVFLETRMFKTYFFEKIYYNLDDYNCFYDLFDIPQDLLIDFQLNEKKPVKDLKDFEKFVNASKLMKASGVHSSQKSIQFNVNAYFFEDANEKSLLDLIKKEFEEDLDMLSLQKILTGSKEIGFDKKKTIELLEELERKGEIYKPKLKFYKPFKHPPKEWFK